MKYKTKHCNHCGASFLDLDFISARKDGFCSDKCRAAYVKKLRKQGRTEHPQKLIDEANA